MKAFSELEKTFIIAEIGVNHEGDVACAKNMIKLAAECGVDAVKFQTYKAEQYVSIAQQERRERVERFQLTKDEFKELSEYAKNQNVIFFSTPLHADDVEFLNEIVPLIKISSGDLTHLELIKAAAEKNKPMIISTGMGSKEEVAAAVNAVLSVRPDIIEKQELMLMHCVAAYPTPNEQVNLRNISWLKDTFKVPVGYSDHTLGTKACELSIAVGAIAIEKHFTYRKEDQAFHDHHISADPADMRQLVDTIRETEILLGNYNRTLQPGEEPGIKHLRRSLAVNRDIKAGEKLSESDITWLRPAWGLLPEDKNKVLGKALNRDIAAGDIIYDKDLDAA